MARMNGVWAPAPAPWASSRRANASSGFFSNRIRGIALERRSVTFADAERDCVRPTSVNGIVQECHFSIDVCHMRDTNQGLYRDRSERKANAQLTKS
jgi:hypothetical protein